MSRRSYGWNHSRPVRGALKLALDLKPESELPQQTDMLTEFPDVYDQQQLGSCVANGIAGLIERQTRITKYPWQFTPSRLFIYFNGRQIEGTVLYDSGLTVADGIKSVNDYGCCPEASPTGQDPGWYWTYDNYQVKYLIPPAPQCYKDAILHKALKAHQVDLNRLNVLNALAAKIPFAFGFVVYESFESNETAKTGIMSIPADNENVLGGHCVDAIGYRLGQEMGTQGVKDWVLCRNSWGRSFGQAGNFWAPLDQIICNPDFSSDAWAVDLVGYAK